MLIDWFTVIAQGINFLVLVWLLKRFLYAPILKAIDTREKGIVARLAEAEKKQSEAQAARDDFQRKDSALEEQRAALLQKSAEDAGAERKRLLDAAQTDADAARSKWQDALRAEQVGFGEEVVRRTQAGVFDVARKALAELASAPLEGCVSDVFITRLRGLDGAAHDQLAASFRAASTPVLIRSAFDLPPAQRAAITAAVGDIFAIQAPLHFETAPSLISGIELTMNGQKIAWSISDFLASLEKDAARLVEEKAAPPAPPSKDPPGTHLHLKARGTAPPPAAPPPAAPISPAPVASR